MQILSGTAPCESSDQASLVNLTTLDPSWAKTTDGSSWVSYENSVCIGCSLATPVYNAQQLALGYHFVPGGKDVNFGQQFFIPTGYVVTGATLQVFSDDTANLSLINPANPNGASIFSNDGSAHFCNCTVFSTSVKPIKLAGAELTNFLQVGQLNTLDLSITQAGESSYGVDWDLSLTLTPIGIPEPSTLSFMALGSLGVLFYKRLRRA